MEKGIDLWRKKEKGKKLELKIVRIQQKKIKKGEGKTVSEFMR